MANVFVGLATSGASAGRVGAFRSGDVELALPASGTLKIQDSAETPVTLLSLNEATGAMALGKAGANVTVAGNLVVNGTTTTVNSTIVQVDDNLLVLNSGPSASRDAGMLIERYQTENDAGTGDVVGDTPALTGTAQGGGTDYITLAVGASASDDFYNNWWVKITGGTGPDQVRKITDYEGATKKAYVSDWTVDPDETSTYALYNRPFIGSFYDESADEWYIGATAVDPGAAAVGIQDAVKLHVGGLTADDLATLSGGFTSSSASSVAGGLTLTAAGLTMTGLHIGGASAEIGNVYLDGFFRFDPVSAPAYVDGKGFLFVADDGGDEELYYRTGTDREIQITKDGAINVSSPAVGLDEAYDKGGSGVGRTITVDSGAVVLNQTKTTEATGTLSLTFAASTFTGGPSGILVDLSGATDFTDAMPAAIKLKGKDATQYTIGIMIDDKFDAPITIASGGIMLGANYEGSVAFDNSQKSLSLAFNVNSATLHKLNIYAGNAGIGGSELQLGTQNGVFKWAAAGLTCPTSFTTMTFTSDGKIDLDAKAASAWGISANTADAETLTIKANNVGAGTGAILVDTDGTLTATVDGTIQLNYGDDFQVMAGAAACTVTIESGSSGTIALGVGNTQASALTIATRAAEAIITIDSNDKNVEFNYPPIASATTVNLGSTANPWGDFFIGDNKLIKFGNDQDATVGFISASSKVQFSNYQWEFAGNVDAVLGLDVSGGNFTAAGGTVDLDPTQNFTLDMDAAKTATITLADNLANALLIQETGNAYLAIDTTDAAEVMTFGNATTDPNYVFAGDVAGRAIKPGTDQVLDLGAADKTFRKVFFGEGLILSNNTINATTGAVNDLVYLSGGTSWAPASNAAYGAGPWGVLVDSDNKAVEREGVATVQVIAAGTAAAAGNALYLSDTAGDVVVFADLGAGDDIVQVGVAVEAIAGGATGKMLIQLADPIPA